MSYGESKILLAASLLFFLPNTAVSQAGLHDCFRKSAAPDKSPESEAPPPHSRYNPKYITNPHVRLGLENAYVPTKPFSKSLGDLVLFDDHELEVVAQLGRGAEGEVYSVLMKDRLLTLKIFKEDSTTMRLTGKSEARSNVEELKRKRLMTAVNTPKIEATDRTGRLLLYEDLDSISAVEVLENHAIYGIEEETWTRAFNQMNRWRKAISESDHIGFEPPFIQFVYSFKYNEFYLIDPF